MGYTWKKAVEPFLRRLRQEKEDIDAEAEAEGDLNNA